ncbi:MAG: U32 family peptidase [Elusimicrobiales bacterium]|nr:U32 family peptidase [Elusimicrobiales bacterium]HOL63421.1 U32 family peptidase [Elusimicrobiales bacterium]HPO95643.1 U32 family peptidase [Elusimicrobiales bacterium]
MRIVSCVTDPYEIPVLKKIGADEIYIAYSKILNYGEAMSFKSLADVISCVKLAKKNKLKIHLAANGIASKKETITLAGMIGDIKKIIDIGIDGLIVSNVGILKIIKKERINVNLHLSSVNPVFNTYALDFFHSNFGLSRVILPNQLSARESEGIINYAKEKKIETEVFYFKFFGCPYINGFCYMHNNSLYTRNIKSERGLCLLGKGSKKARIYSFNNNINPSKKIIERVMERVNFGGSPRILNVSSFFDFYSMGVNFVKYGSRTDSSNLKFYKVKVIRKAIDRLSELTAKYDLSEAKIRFMESFK